MTIFADRQVPSRGRQKTQVGWFGLSILATILAMGTCGFRVNLTSSQPVGLWRIVSLDRSLLHGDLVFICPPATPLMREARSRGYLRPGLCEEGVAPLIKTVAATPGQIIEIGDHVRINGSELAHSQLMAMDSQGRPMMPYRGGLVRAGTVFVHSDYPGSFDSRYFGPLPTENILGLAQEVWTYAP